MTANRTSRLGVKTGGQFVFRCASCGGVAAALAIINDDREVDGGPMPGGGRLSWKPGAPSYRLDFINVNTGQASTELTTIADAKVIDPLDVSRFHWELAAFCCHSCGLNYCPKCWETQVEFDEDFYYDCTRGRCPQGHAQKLDD